MRSTTFDIFFIKIMYCVNLPFEKIAILVCFSESLTGIKVSALVCLFRPVLARE